MAMWERHTQKLCPKEPSFSSSLLDAIYRSIDAAATNDPHKPQDPAALSRNNAARAEDDADSIRRAIMVEKWIENYTTTTTTTGGGASRSTPRHFPSTSASSTDSSVFSSSSETESSSASRSSPKSSSHKLQKSRSAQSQTPPPPPASAKREGGGRFLKTKTRAQKIYGDLKKAKEPISPGGRISSFFNSIFSPRNLKTSQCNNGDEWSPMRKSRSMKDAATCALTSRSCLSKNASSRGSKSKRSVRFCPVSVIVDEHCQPCGQKSIYNDEFAIKKNMMDSLRLFEGENVRKYEVRDCYAGGQDFDDMSCASSDLFELENIGRVEYAEELPVYETTSLEMMNQRM